MILHKNAEGLGGIRKQRIFRSSLRTFYLRIMWQRANCTVFLPRDIYLKRELYLVLQKLAQFKVGSFVRLCPILSAFDFCFMLCHIFG